ncbi:cell division topological specificity factor [Deinococcus sp. HSC-46F16]|uniref:cell division topological specificity factor MinE n=1 Tax=Deinococcus sp. HSC-46F16 TaxID=2910968 RepID=UPI0020A1E98F|nr:cell division topological specificity factor MinE [Deinococcus sp. HSC-46F16]MCP2015863.1 cell division topological specificity factor [Deinococcus sp. HSC-46F16]
MFSWMKGRRSKETLKDRLELVLAYDRAQIPPGKVDALRHDLLEVVKRYFPAGNSNVEVEQRGDQVVLSASISLEEGAGSTGDTRREG